MNRRLLLWSTGIIATLIAPLAAAQEVTIGYQGLPYKAPAETATGIQVSDSTLLHVGAGAEAGYDTNVFYSDSSNTVGAGIYRATFFGELTNGTRTTGGPRQLSFDARAGLQYRRYQFSDSDVQTHGNLDTYKNAWMPTAGVAVSAGSGQVGFGFADTYARIEDPPYLPGQSMIARDNNQASIEGRWSPGGGRLTGTLRYTNMVDYFESVYTYADSVTNLLMFDGSWKWLPKTALFVNVQQGYIFYFNGSSKASSYPLRAVAGLRGLLTQKTSAVLSLGYANGFYAGASTSGFLGSTFAELAFTVRPTMLSRIVLGARHDFINAVISSFAYTDTVYASYVQQIGGRFGLDLSGRYTHLNYQGQFVDPAQQGRSDNFFQVGATLDYFMRNWAYAGLGYSLLANDSTGLMMAALPTNYVKQQFFVRLGITY